MEQLLNTGIKQIIDEHPRVGDILESHDIGCVPCSLGTCLLKDIVDIHNLSPEIEREMMTAIAREVYPDRDIQIKLSERKSKALGDGPKYSPPMKLLVDEHTLIKRVIALIPAMGEKMDLEQAEDRTLVLQAVEEKDNAKAKEHLLSYGELLTQHIRKEDEILYPWMDREMSDRQVGHMFAQFQNVDQRFAGIRDKYEGVVDSLEQRFL